MTKLVSLWFVLSFILFVSPESISAQIGRLPLSPEQKIIQNIGITDITVHYSRPSKRGRSIFGDLVPYGKYWRTGANRNTTIEISEDFFIDSKSIAKGKYAIFTIPGTEEWDVILYHDTDNWDVPESVDPSKIAARITVPSTTLPLPLEVFTISIGDFTNYNFDLIIAWDQTKISVPIQLNTRALMDQKIQESLDGPGYGEFYLAAVYQMESGGEYAKGLEWINKAIEIQEKAEWWDLRVKAILLDQLNRKKEAKEIARAGMKLALEANREYAINEFNRLLNE